MAAAVAGCAPAELPPDFSLDSGLLAVGDEGDAGLRCDQFAGESRGQALFDGERGDVGVEDDPSHVRRCLDRRICRRSLRNASSSSSKIPSWASSSMLVTGVALARISSKVGVGLGEGDGDTGAVAAQTVAGWI
jgi:hypothetical protein